MNDGPLHKKVSSDLRDSGTPFAVFTLHSLIQPCATKRLTSSNDGKAAIAPTLVHTMAPT
ncbi:hypothetical protein NSS66_23930 [Paenibacillus sp. FSL R10-2748]|nr:hypothetical protein [Paenibacillus peoriae]